MFSIYEQSLGRHCEARVNIDEVLGYKIVDVDYVWYLMKRIRDIKY
jgi:hypothetical protein